MSQEVVLRLRNLIWNHCLFHSFRRSRLIRNFLPLSGTSTDRARLILRSAPALARSLGNSAIHRAPASAPAAALIHWTHMIFDRLPPFLSEALSERGYAAPTPVQAAVLEPDAEG